MHKLAIFAGSDMKTFGGGEKYVIEFINRLPEFDTTIFSYHGKPPFRMTLNKLAKMVNADISYYSAPEIPLLKERVMLTISGFRTLGKLKDFDVVYCLDNSFWTNVMLLLGSKRYGFKYILGIHDANILKNEPIKGTFVRRLLLKFYAPVRNFGIMLAPNIRVVNESDGIKLRKMGYKGGLYSITDFINVKSYYNRSTAQKNKRFVVLFVGRLSIQHKGIDLLEEIINKTLEAYHDIIFHIVGSGDDGEDIIRGLVRKYPRNVVWLGFVSEKRLIREYLSSDVLVFPSRFESFGMSLAEGQGYGLPAIAFNVRGPNVTMKNKLQGKLITPFDIDGFVSEIFRVQEALEIGSKRLSETKAFDIEDYNKEIWRESNIAKT